MHILKKLSLVAIAIVAMASTLQAEDKVKRYLYVSSRDGAGGRGGKGIYIYDIDNNHQLVRFISMPKLGGTRGMCGCAATGKLWIAHGNDKLLCMSIKTGKVLWEKTYPKEEGGCDRIGVTPDGKKLYAPSGWWSSDPFVKVIDGNTGELLKKIKVAPKGGLHNLIVSEDGRHAYIGSTRFDALSVIDTRRDEVVQRVGPIIGVIQPFTINGSQTLAYINTHLYRKGHGPGFEIGDLKTGKILHIVKVPGLEDRKQRCHGIGLTPDEKEVWVVDQGHKELHIFDNTVMPPRFKKTIPMAAKVHGWICFSRDGKYGWCDTGEVFDVATKKRMAQLTDSPNGKGKPVMSSKFFEAHFQNGEVVWIGQQMGVGYKKAER